MCGISGLIDLNSKNQSATVEAQLATLDHRGPDSKGIYNKGPVSIGQTRLSIIDLVTGDPPVTNEDGSVGVVLNGEIYNYRELRKELEGRGHSFKTTGDTEVLAHLAEESGPLELASRLDGMFSFAIWNDRTKQLVLGRDRLGKKPLYYWKGRGCFVFGSEIKALLAHPRIAGNLDPQALPAYLAFGYVPTPFTFFEGIQSLPPGSVLSVGLDLNPDLGPYWQPKVGGLDGALPLRISAEEAREETRRLIDAAVRKRLVADVPLGAFLSGGVDSSTVVATMAKLSREPIKTFTIGFEDHQGFDERPFARLVAERFQTDHTEFVVHPNAVDLVERLVWHHDQAFGDSSAVPTHLLSELTRRHVTVALCGDGGDEVFGGYERFAAGLALHRYQAFPRTVRSAINQAVSLLSDDFMKGRGGSIKRFARRSEMEVFEAFRSWISYVPDELRTQLTQQQPEWAFGDYRKIWQDSEGAPLLNRLQHLNLKTYLLDDLLPKVDRTSMAHGLEVRSPLLDRDLLEFAFKLPPSARIRRFSLKRVLKGAMKEVLPREILHRQKRGFGIPVDRWFRTDLHKYLQATVGSPKARIRDHLNGQVIDRILWEHHREISNHGQELWTLLTLEAFLRKQSW